MNVIIKAENVDHWYGEDDNRTRALKDISLEIDEGSFVAVLGHNGSGKSTLAKHFNAILTPELGKIYVAGMDTSDKDLVIDIRRTVGMVFQNPDNQIVASVVEDDVAFGPENIGMEQSQIRPRVDAALMSVGMYEMREHAPHMLSGGQKQRVAIAGVIAMRPRCIVLDEPTAMLDPSGRREVINTIHRLNRDYGITIILITHHMNETVGADRLIVMSDGEIIADGSPKSVFTRVDMLRRAGLSVPDTTQLIYLLRQEGFDLPLDALTVDECAAAIYKKFA
ncbi:MAG: energy-coupling factor transporter ATPase [Oscillospiraceae bacterium]|nr:energy-coupling factor transporter ATPase [Oscillospiraceae bacterium]